MTKKKDEVMLSVLRFYCYGIAVSDLERFLNILWNIHYVCGNDQNILLVISASSFIHLSFQSDFFKVFLKEFMLQ